MFPVSFIFDYQHIVYDFHEGVEAFVTEQGEGGIGLEGIGGEEDVAENFGKLSICLLQILVSNRGAFDEEFDS